MPSIQTNIPKELIGNPSSEDIAKLFNVLDNTLLGIISPRSISFSATRFTEIYTEILYGNNLSLIPELTELLSISDCINQIINLYASSGVKDPILSISGKYFVIDNFYYRIYTNNPSNNIFKFFNIVYSNRIENGVSIAPSFIKYYNNIEISLELSEFFVFLRERLPRTSSSIPIATITTIITKIFLYCLQEYIKDNSNNSYYPYNNQLYSEGEEDYSSYNFTLNTNYNFYSDLYEKTFNKDFRYPSSIPNYYAIDSYIKDTNNNNLKDHITIFNSVKGVSKTTITGEGYYEKFAEFISQNLDIFNVTSLPSIMKNYLLDSNTIDKYKIQISQEVLPYNTVVRFTNVDTSERITDYLINNSLEMLTLNNLYGSLYEDTSSLTKNFTSLIEKQVITENTNGRYINAYGNKYNITNIRSIIDNSIQYTNYQKVYNFFDTGDIGFFIDENSSFKFGVRNFNNFKGTPNLFTFVQLQTLVEQEYDKFIDFNKIYNLEILNNKSLGYFIEKITNKKEQVIGISKDNKISNYEFIDSQVIYGEETEYNVYSTGMIPELKYDYSNISNTDLSLQLRCNIELNPKIYKNQIFKKSKAVHDNPPVSPNIKFVPYVNVNNLIGLFFNMGFGSYRETPTSILPTDGAVFSQLLLTQNSKDNKILFESDDSINEIQIFYTTIKPTSYSDFSSATLLSLKKEDTTSNATNVRINPNTKYYFTFRALDVHGLLSNPSRVFEVELVDNDGAVYSVINVIDFEQKKDYDTTKSLRKYLHIRPSFNNIQLTPNEDENTVSLGTNNNFWGKKYKVRVTSKKTGKTFDVNVSFIKNEYNMDDSKKLVLSKK